MDIFVIGATGYIGGAVALKLRDAGHRVTGLARTAPKADQLKSIGIRPVMGTLFDAPAITAAALSAEAIINASDSDNAYVVATLLDALKGSGKTLIHTSGSSIVGDRAGGRSSDRVYSEDARPVPRLEKAGRVAIDDAILAASNHGIRSVVICPSLVYGLGPGLHTESVQIPMLRTLAQRYRTGVHIGAGENRWSNVHIEDLAELYLLALRAADAGSFLFAENGECAMKDVAANISHGLGFAGHVTPLEIGTAIELLGVEAAEFALASNSRVRAAAARALGWKPRNDDLLSGLREGRYLH